MKQMMKMAGLLMVVVFLCTGNVFALNITIPDGNKKADNNATYNKWWNTDMEDQEVEPGMETGQKWDLEAFLLDDWILTMIGGYNFKDGQASGNRVYKSGDLFFDLDITGPNKAQYGASSGSSDGNKTVKNTYGYDYVLDLDFSTFTYQAYALNNQSETITSYYKQNYGSNPWQYSGGGILIGNGSFGYTSGLTDAATGFSGGTHNAVTFDLSTLSFLPPGTDFIAHFTMGCGNDNLMGQGTTPTPEPATLGLLALGLAGLAVYRRKQIVR